jgi:RNA polymerase sigma-70 factor, ECF subfamily
MDPLRRNPNPLLLGSGFTRFYRRHARPLLVFFARRVLEPELAHDLAAETFAEAFLSRHRFRGSTDREATAWLYAIARGQLNRYLRRGYSERKAIERLGLQVSPLSPEEHQRIEELADLAGVRDLMAEAMRDLAPRNREALWLRVVKQLSYPQVAAQLDISEQAARARVSRGLRALRDALNDSRVEELIP